MNRRRRLVELLIMYLLCAWLPAAKAWARPAVSIFIDSGYDSLPAFKTALEGFKNGFDANYLNPHTISNDIDLKKFKKEIIAENPGFILALGSKSLLVANYLAPDLPRTYIIFTMAFKPTYALNDRVYGVSLDIPAETIVKDIRTLLPGARKIGVLYTEKDSRQRFNELKAEVDRANRSDPVLRNAPRKLEIISKAIAPPPADSKPGVPNPNVAKMRDQILESGIDVFLYITDLSIKSEDTRQIISYATRRGIPFVGASMEQLDQGALWVRTSIPDTQNCSKIGLQAANLAKELAAGRRPSPPIQTFQQIKLILNKKNIQRTFNLILSNEAMQRVDQVVGE